MLSSDFSPLARLPTLRDSVFNEPPSIQMVKGTRLYACQEEDVPCHVTPTAMRDLYTIVLDRKASAFISKSDVFVTCKDISVPRDMKKVAVEDIFPSFEMMMVRRALCDFMLNEVFPCVAPSDSSKWSLEFLMDFDRILNIPVSNQNAVMMKTYNFRNLRHRISTKALTAKEVTFLRNRLPKYTELLDMFQDFVFNPV